MTTYTAQEGLSWRRTSDAILNRVETNLKFKVAEEFNFKFFKEELPAAISIFRGKLENVSREDGYKQVWLVAQNPQGNRNGFMDVLEVLDLLDNAVRVIMPQLVFAEPEWRSTLWALAREIQISVYNLTQYYFNL